MLNYKTASYFSRKKKKRKSLFGITKNCNLGLQPQQTMGKSPRKSGRKLVSRGKGSREAVGRERLARWRWLGSLAARHSSPIAGIICGTVHVHCGMVLYKHHLKSPRSIKSSHVELPSHWCCCIEPLESKACLLCHSE